MSKLTNVLLMLQLLQNGRKYSIKELAEKIEVSERMIRKYKDELECAGIFIDTIKGPYGGYVLNKDINIPYLNFNYSDIDVIDKANALINNPIVKNELNDIKSKLSLDKIEDRFYDIDLIKSLINYCEPEYVTNVKALCKIKYSDYLNEVLNKNNDFAKQIDFYSYLLNKHWFY